MENPEYYRISRPASIGNNRQILKANILIEALKDRNEVFRDTSMLQ